VLEYLTVEEATQTLSDCHRVLQPGGLIRLCQTDIAAIVSAYVAGGDVAPTSEAVARARKFLASAAPDRTSLSGRLFRRGGVQQLFDRPTVEWMLVQAGFTDIRFWKMHEGQCPDLLDLEHEWDPPLIRVEARKPGSGPMFQPTTGVGRGEVPPPAEAGPV
jgi:predicted SAM-dependent methyltransferase